ncbi:hypothetical protein F5876DRAFT_63677 [Lentinula aff. lateritia]|uniref:Uncharacterized protein n=1 Tax=Lentinula aff. lateritia TaxID=2804960 RepID=A0ACC1U725_9AGAR|nr:hypothetical protein F5876DRAFT_63677 [Lentinula aff. lateritia]
MSEPPLEANAHEAEVSVYLTPYSVVKSKAKKAVSSLKKDTGAAKMKSFRFTFGLDEENYVSLMNTILSTMGLETQFKATKKKSFCMKIAVPPKKKTKACDVENFSEYITQARQIVTTKCNKTIIMLIDGKEILESCGKNKGGNGDSEEEDIDEDDSSMSAMEKELARIRGLLEKEHGNDYNMTYTWLNPNTGKKVPLSPMAMDEWTHAIYSGLADKKHPPTDPYSPHFGSIN